MRKFMKKRLLLLALIVTLSTAPIQPILADEPAVSQNTSVTSDAQAQKWLEPLVVGTVRVANNVTFAVQEAAMLSNEDSNVVTFTLKVTNDGNRDFQFVDYWIRLQTKSGIPFNVTLLPEDKDKNRIPAGTSQELRFVAKVSGKFTLQDLEFRIVKYDFDPSNYGSDYIVVMGTITVPADYTNRVPVGMQKVISVNGLPLLTNVTRVVMNTGSQFNTPTIHMELENIGTKSIGLPEYQFYLRTSEGLLYPLDASGMQKDTSIHPRFTRDVQLSGTLPSNLSLNNWELVITVPEAGGKESLPVAFYHLPAPDSGQDTVAIPAGEIKNLDVDNNIVETSIKRVLTTKSNDDFESTIYYVMKNTGNSPVSIPKYQFTLETADGLSYPVSADHFDNLTINPQVSKEITLHVSVPVSVNIQGASLKVNAPADGQSTGPLLASYHLPDASSSNAVVGDTAEITNKHGVYTVQLNTIQRLPLDDSDVLTANIIVKNRSIDSLPIPELMGKFVLDGKVEVPVQVVQADHVIGLQSNDQVRFDLFGTIPYTYQYTTLKLVLLEKVDENRSNELVEFERNAITSQPPVVAVGKAYEIEGTGKNAALAIKNVRTYEGMDGTLLSVLLNVQNLEKRFADTPNIVAYFKTKNDEMYPAVISELKDKIGPRTVATISISGVLPKDTKSEDLQLLVGEAVGGSNEKAYVNAVSFAFPVEDKTPKTNYEKMDFFPYEVSFSNFRTDILTAGDAIGQFRVAFDYEMSRSLVANSDAGDHKLIVEFKDRDGDLAFTETIALGTPDGLEVGKGIKEFVKTDSLILARLPYLQYYQINVYDEYKGAKKLIASQNFSWFGD